MFRVFGFLRLLGLFMGFLFLEEIGEATAERRRRGARGFPSRLLLLRRIFTLLGTFLPIVLGFALALLRGRRRRLRILRLLFSKEFGNDGLALGRVLGLLERLFRRLVLSRLWRFGRCCCCVFTCCCYFLLGSFLLSGFLQLLLLLQ